MAASDAHDADHATQRQVRGNRPETGVVQSALAFVFDLDGTLVDSVYQHVLAWREALETAGMALVKVVLEQDIRDVARHHIEIRVTFPTAWRGPLRE